MQNIRYFLVNLKVHSSKITALIQVKLNQSNEIKCMQKII